MPTAPARTTTPRLTTTPSDGAWWIHHLTIATSRGGFGGTHIVTARSAPAFKKITWDAAQQLALSSATTQWCIHADMDHAGFGSRTVGRPRCGAAIVLGDAVFVMERGTDRGDWVLTLRKVHGAYLLISAQEADRPMAEQIMAHVTESYAQHLIKPLLAHADAVTQHAKATLDAYRDRTQAYPRLPQTVLGRAPDMATVTWPDMASWCASAAAHLPTGVAWRVVTA